MAPSHLSIHPTRLWRAAVCSVLIVAFQAVSVALRCHAASAPGAELFADKTVRKFKIEIVGDQLEALKKDNRQYVRATVREGTKVFTNVAVHLKGMGSFRPLNEKPSFAVRFDKYVPEQRYDGLSKFLLNNSSQDGTYLAEYISTSVFRDAGLPAARVTHAYVELNGRDVGLYVLIEAFNHDFLRQHFRSARGHLYEGYTQDIDQQLDQDNGKPGDQADRKQLVEAARIPDLAQRWRKLQQVLDVDEFISFTVLEMFVGHVDGYALNRNNYRIYHDPYSDRFAFITTGLDWGFENTGLSVRPPLNSIMVRGVLETPEGLARYKRRVSQLFTNVLKVAVLTNRINEVAAKLKAAARNPAEASEWEPRAATKRNQIVERARYVATLLALPEPEVVKFDKDGIAKISSWRQKIDPKEAKPVLVQASYDGRATYTIQTGTGPCIASWRSRLELEAGKYRFSAQAKTTGLVALTNAPGLGAGIRISGSKRTQALFGDVNWTLLEFGFELPAATDVELVCELRAEKGQVWFDASSLRLARVNEPKK